MTGRVFVIVCVVSIGAAEVFAGVARLHVVSTAVPFPRGLAMVDDTLFVLCRGRARSVGGVSADVDDQAGTLYAVNPETAHPVESRERSTSARDNGRVFVQPADPPFRLWNRSANPPWMDRLTDRPYCGLRFHPPTQSLYICCFSGIDKPKKPGEVSFSKNMTDALLRYDLRTGKWYEVERHDIEAGSGYPHHDPRHSTPPHGWLNGPDNCLAVGNSLYAVAKENSVLVRYDLSPLIDDPEAGCPPSEFILGTKIGVKGIGLQEYNGHSALAVHDRYLYLAYRTSSVIVRLPIDADGHVVRPIVGELVARFEPYDPITLWSANLTDMAFDSVGRLYVVSAQPARVYRFRPDPSRVFDARNNAAEPWLDISALTNDPKAKSENILIDSLDRLFVTSGDSYDCRHGACGTIYRVDTREEPSAR